MCCFTFFSPPVPHASCSILSFHFFSATIPFFHHLPPSHLYLSLTLLSPYPTFSYLTPASVPSCLFLSFFTCLAPSYACLTCSVRVIIRTSRMMTGDIRSTTQSSAMPITTWLLDAFISETSVRSITCLVKRGRCKILNERRKGRN